MKTTRCSAITGTGKRCTFTASTKVDGEPLCGNHAAQARAKVPAKPQQAVMFSRAPKTAVLKPMVQGQAAGEPKTTFIIPAAPAELPIIDQVIRLIELGLPRRVIQQILDAWKAGEL